LKGPYLGQQQPGSKPRPFARGIISTFLTIHGNVSFSPDGKEIYWSPMADKEPYTTTILFTKLDNGLWTAPMPVSFSSEFHDDVPFLAPDGKLYFLSSRPTERSGQPGGENLWCVERVTGRWTAPRIVSPVINAMEPHWQLSVSKDGSVFFASGQGQGRGLTDIYVSRPTDKGYGKPVNLGPGVNTEYTDFAPWIAPDESYLIFTRIRTGGGEDGLYISFRDEKGNWAEAQSLGIDGMLPSLSPDEKFLFFTGSAEKGEKGIYWVAAGFIEERRPRRHP
jgi:Tol biopolymer transport system component